MRRTVRSFATLSVLLLLTWMFPVATEADLSCQVWYPCEGYYITAWCNESECIKNCRCDWMEGCVWYSAENICTGENLFEFLCCGMPLP